MCIGTDKVPEFPIPGPLSLPTQPCVGARRGVGFSTGPSVGQDALSWVRSSWSGASTRLDHQENPPLSLPSRIARGSYATAVIS